MLRKKLPWLLLSVAIAAAVIWAVVSQSRSFSLPALFNSMQSANSLWLLAAFLCMFGFILFEGLAIRSLVKGLTFHRANTGLLYSASDIFFSAITPFATGGQPASAFFMIRDGISAVETAVILLLNLILYTLALLLLGLLALLLHPETVRKLDGLSRFLLVIGYVILFVLIAVFYLLVRKERIIYYISVILIRLGRKLHLVRNETALLEKLDDTLLQYRAAAQLTAGRNGVIISAFIMNLLQRLSQSMVVVCVYLALHGIPNFAADVWSAQIMTMVASNSVPIPGAMGVADYVLIEGLETVPGIPLEANLALVSRSISFYICVMFSAVIMALGYLRRTSFSKETE